MANLYSELQTKIFSDHVNKANAVSQNAKIIFGKSVYGIHLIGVVVK